MSARPDRPRPAIRLVALAAVAVALASCAGSEGTGTPAASARAVASPGGSVPALTPDGSFVPSVLPSALASAADASASPAIPVDVALLDVLPSKVDGLDRLHDPTIDAGAFTDPSLPGIATGGATALYIDPPTGQFAYAAVIRLTAGGLSDAQFRAWRDTFNVGACAQAGGVGGHAQATLGGHVTYIGTCTGGLTTYHTILAGRGLLVSVSSVGDRRLGEKLVAALPS